MIHYISKRDVVGTWNTLFCDDEIEKIIEAGTALETIKGVVGTPGAEQEPDPELRSSDVSFIYRDINTEWIFERYDGAVNRLNSLLFNVDVEPLRILQFTTYRGHGDHYTWHWDMRCAPEANSTEVVQQRKISIVTQLSDPDEYEGGVLKLAPCGCVFDVERAKGNTSVFLSFVNHQVTPVTSGTRYSLVGWYEGPDWR
jgi:PKHD-type hydroxylase